MCAPHAYVLVGRDYESDVRTLKLAASADAPGHGSRTQTVRSIPRGRVGWLGLILDADPIV